MVRRIIVGLLSCILAIVVLPQCAEEKETLEYIVTFETLGGTPVPEIQKVPALGNVVKPEDPQKDGYIFCGWYTQSGLKFNFNTPVTSDLVLTAKWWDGPEKYVFLQDYDVFFNYDIIKSYFGNSIGKNIAVGRGFIIYVFERPHDTMIKLLKEHLKKSIEYDIPILVQLDAITFMDSRPDIWNWWNEKRAGYKPDNRYNVEWTSWSPEDAVKIGWLNWGRQIRITPMPNLMSPEYRIAVKRQVEELLSIVKAWYDELPKNKKYLLGGIKVTGEMAIGVNNWYYPNGNDYLDKPEDQDPKTGININILPSRGVQTIGFAALKTGMFKESGNITGEDIAMLSQKHSEYMSKICYEIGFPREKIYAHAGGVGKDLEACLNTYACPSWSFYLKDALRPSESSILALLEKSDAPYFGIAEWAIGNNVSSQTWTDAIYEALTIPRCRYLTVYQNVVGNAAFAWSPDYNAIEGIKVLQSF